MIKCPHHRENYQVIVLRRGRGILVKAVSRPVLLRISSAQADDVCVNLVSEYSCWMLGDPHFFFGRSLPFLILSIILKNKKSLYVGSFNYFSYTIQIGSNLHMETGVPRLDLEAAI